MGATLQPGARWAVTQFRRLLVKQSVVALDVNNETRYYSWVVRSFADSQTERLFRRQPVRRFSAEVQRAALRKLFYLDAAERISDPKLPPGNRLEKLRGRRAGQYSIRVSDQWRICFRWRDGDAHDVEITDYH